MDFWSTEEEAFRQEVHQFIQKELPPGWRGFGTAEEYATEEGWAFAQQMAKKLGAKRWLAIDWPKEYGGLGASYIKKVVYQEEVNYHGVPGVDMGVSGTGIVGPVLMLFGSEEQKKEHLPKIAAGEEFWCQGFSEPNAGSDLFAVQCRAIPKGNEYIISGQKTWTSAAIRADWCWLAARTNADGPRHRGISMFIIDMKSKGITLRPLIHMTGHPDWCEVFFDEVHVPKSNMVGEENHGAKYILATLDLDASF